MPKPRKIAFEEEPSEEPEVEEINDTDEEQEDNEIDIEDEDEGISLADLMQTFFAGENGKNLVDTIQDLKSSIDNQNRVLMKIGGLIEKYFSKQN
jgi:hypothetical protein